MSFRLVAILVLGMVIGGWLTFDGSRALLVGDYVTPKTGQYAGRLGPWSRLVSAAGLNPRGVFMKGFHVVLGLFWLASCVLVTLGVPAGRLLLTGCALASLWYLPIGTVISVIVIVLLYRAT